MQPMTAVGPDPSIPSILPAAARSPANPPPPQGEYSNADAVARRRSRCYTRLPTDRRFPLP